MVFDPRHVVELARTIKQSQPTLGEAKRLLVTAGYIGRIVKEDGMDYEGSSDYRTNRINIELIQGRVVDAYVG